LKSTISMHLNVVKAALATQEHADERNDSNDFSCL
jgi:hypothetical protein